MSVQLWKQRYSLTVVTSMDACLWSAVCGWWWMDDDDEDDDDAAVFWSCFRLFHDDPRCPVLQEESGQQESSFSLSIPCQFCWQLDPSQYRCSNSTNCMTVSCPRKRYNATCDVLDHVHCLGTTCFSCFVTVWTSGTSCRTCCWKRALKFFLIFFFLVARFKVSI